MSSVHYIPRFVAILTIRGLLDPLHIKLLSTGSFTGNYTRPSRPWTGPGGRISGQPGGLEPLLVASKLPEQSLSFIFYGLASVAGALI